MPGSRSIPACSSRPPARPGNPPRGAAGGFSGAQGSWLAAGSGRRCPGSGCLAGSWKAALLSRPSQLPRLARAGASPAVPPGGQGDTLGHEGSLRGAGGGREGDSDTLAGGCGTPKPPLPPDLGTLGQRIWASGVTTHPARPQRAATDGAQSWAETCPAHLSSPERSCHPQTPRQCSVVGFASGSALVKLRACHRFPELPPALTLPATLVYPLDLDGNGEAREASPGNRRHARRALIRAGKSPPTAARGSEPGTD